jgi:hypothetical protein
MRRTLLFAFIILVMALSSRGQGKYTYEIGMVSDNDAYLMLAIDQYYTNGLK